MGAFGGSLASVLPVMEINDVRLSRNMLNLSCSTGQITTSGVSLLNMSSQKITISSISMSHTSEFSLNKDFSGQVLDIFTSDSLIVSFHPLAWGRILDTLRIIYTISGQSHSLNVPMTGTANSSPYLYKPIPTQRAAVGQVFSFQIPDSTFLDSDLGDSLTYQATGCPSWLSFNPTTHTFQGTPSQITSQPLTIGIVARDIFQAGASAYFRLVVSGDHKIIVYPGWNMVSIPCLPPDNNAEIVFPKRTAVSFATKQKQKHTKRSRHYLLETGIGSTM